MKNQAIIIPALNPTACLIPYVYEVVSLGFSVVLL